jgi:hypothetical protein
MNLCTNQTTTKRSMKCKSWWYISRKRVTHKRTSGPQTPPLLTFTLENGCISALDSTINKSHPESLHAERHNAVIDWFVLRDPKNVASHLLDNLHTGIGTLPTCSFVLVGIHLYICIKNVDLHSWPDIQRGTVAIYYYTALYAINTDIGLPLDLTNPSTRPLTYRPRPRSPVSR